MEEKERELNFWNHSVLERSKREIATNKLHLNILLDFARKPIIYREKNRPLRRFPRSSTFWWESVWSSYSHDRFKQTFRLSRSTFTFVLSHIRHKLVKEYIAEEPISPEKRFGICLYRLARGDYLCAVAEMTGLAESTVCKIAIELCNAIIENLWTDAGDRHFPKSVDDFCTSFRKWNMSGSIDMLLLL